MLGRTSGPRIVKFISIKGQGGRSDRCAGRRSNLPGEACVVFRYWQPPRRERVMASVSRFLTQKLRLNVNETKSAVASAGGA